MAKARKHVVDLVALRQAMDRCRLALRRPRQERVNMVQEFVGNHWSEEGTRHIVPVNLIALYVGIVGRTLIPKDPRGLFSTFDQKLRAMVDAEQEWANRQVVKMGLQKQLVRAVTDALFGPVGIMKVALASPQQSQAAGWNLKAGMPFAERVDFDDFVYDVHARDFSEVTFMGHRTRLPLDAVRDDPRFSKERKELVASYDEPYNQEGDLRVSTLGRTFYDVSSQEFVPHVDLWEIYLPQLRLVLTLTDRDGSGEFRRPLLEQEWLGPDRGPYYTLGFQWVPGNPLSKGPVQDLYDMHMHFNAIMRKLMRQAERQKDNVFVQNNTEDGARIMKANDGEILKVDNPDKIQQVTTNPGPNQANILFGQQTFELFNRQAGNLEMIGGLAPQSRTATQDKMLMQAGTAQIASMQQDTTTFVEEVFHGLCWYYHKHPELYMKVPMPIPGLPEMSITRTVTPADRRRVPYEDLDIRIDVYSMQGQTPETKVRNLTQTLQVIQPYLAMAQAQGVAMDVNALVSKLARLLNLPELLEVLTVQEPMPQPQQGQGPQQGMVQPETTRNYVRESVGEGSRPARQQALMEQITKGVGRNGSMPMNPNGM